MQTLSEAPLAPPNVKQRVENSDVFDRFISSYSQWFRFVRCFEFVPSNYENAWSALSSLEPCRFCEWGSGLGVAVGLAEMLGYDACGIEIDAKLAEQSRQFLAEHGLKSPIHTGSYFDFAPEVDLVYVYCWPGQVAAVEQLFFDKMPDHARMLRAYGQDDLRLYVKNPDAIAARDAAK